MEGKGKRQMTAELGHLSRRGEREVWKSRAVVEPPPPLQQRFNDENVVHPGPL